MIRPGTIKKKNPGAEKMIEIKLPWTNFMYGNVARGGPPMATSDDPQSDPKTIPQRSQSNPKMIKNDLKKYSKAIPK